MARKPFTLRKTLVLVTALLAMGTIVWWTNRGPREPVYQGKKLSWFLKNSQNLTVEEWKSLGPDAITWLGYKAAQKSLLDMDRPSGSDTWFEQQRWALRVRMGGSEFDRTRFEAIRTLAELGPEAAPAIPFLAKAASVADHDGRLVAADALIGMGPVSWPALRDAIKNGDLRTQHALIYKLDGRWAYQQMQSDPREFAETVALLVPRAIHEDEDLRRNAGRQLKACGTAWQAQPRVSEGVALVAASLAHDPEPVRRATARFLGDLEEQAAAAIPALTALAEVPDELTRIEALGALCLIEPNNPRWAKELRELVASPNKEVAQAAERTLIHVGK